MAAYTHAWTTKVRPHPGSSAEEIENEPDWGAGHQHRVGYRNSSYRVPGLTHDQEPHDDGEYQAEIAAARKARAELQRDVSTGKLLNFRDMIELQKDFHLRHPENKSLGWRYVLETTEDFVKNKQDWPANVKKRKKEQEDAQAKKKVEHQDEHEWKRDTDTDKHHDAYATGDGQGETKDPSLADKYTPQELALLRALEHEKDYIYNLKENDGKRTSPQNKRRIQVSIDEQDQFSPDNWLPRSSELIRLTGKHPLNAEPNLDRLFEAGLITPNELHYVRNHGAVPRLLWEFHEVDVECGDETTSLSMDTLKSLDAINIPVALACDGNRRKELNMLRKSKGFGWGPGGVSCAYWKGPLMRDVLLYAGVPEDLLERNPGKRFWVNFEGADKPSDGKYSTCIPFQYAMDPCNDIILAYEMNNVPLPPDHGYPVRIIIPGYVGGRCVKWLKRIWISDRENDSHYHIWDNRVLPAFVTEKDGPFAETLFHHPDTACNEQNLNSVIVKPAQGEIFPLSKARKGESFRIAGFAYDGGGHEIQRVEVSLDGGDTWLYCIRTLPEYPIRHGNKFWTWVHWHVDVEMLHLLRATSITVRCFNVFKNTQPRDANWNIMGMMNNCWYVVKGEVVDQEDSEVPAIRFRHPTDPQSDEGWMKPSVENQIAAAKQESGAPQKEFTREEIEKHDQADDCWLVVDGKVYDVTSVLSWHPGGAASILSHAGKVHQDTTDDFSSIHDDYAYKKLNECVLGVVTDKAAQFIKKNAEANAKEKAASANGDDKITLQKHRWVPVRLINREKISEDTRTYTFHLPGDKSLLGLGTCQHIQIGFHFADRMLVRSYTPTRPLLPEAKSDKQGAKVNGHDDGKRSHTSMRDGDGTFDLTVKTYFPNTDQPGGAMSNILDCIPLGEEVEIRGPTGNIVYNGNGNFVIEDRERHFTKVSMVVGGSGLTPAYSLLARVLLTQGDKTQLRVVDANKTPGDILLHDELSDFEKNSNGQLKVTHVLSHAGDDWKGLKGYVTEDIIKDALFPPGDDSVVFLCGPPPMIQKAALPALRDWGYVEDENAFGF